MTRSAPSPEFAPARWPRGMRAEIAAEYIGISVSLLHAEAKAGRMPAAVPVSAGRVVWLREDLDGWLDARAGRADAHARVPTASDPAEEWDKFLRGDRAA